MDRVAEWITGMATNGQLAPLFMLTSVAKDISDISKSPASMRSKAMIGTFLRRPIWIVGMSPRAAAS